MTSKPYNLGGFMGSLREAVAKQITRDPVKVLGALKTAGVRLSAQEENYILEGDLGDMSDSQLEKLFNTKVLGLLGGMDRGSQDSQDRQGGQGGGETR